MLRGATWPAAFVFLAQTGTRRAFVFNFPGPLFYTRLRTWGLLNMVNWIVFKEGWAKMESALRSTIR